ncbi:hypothetical protein CDD83_4679 [Cordyceps sp. RAO-2017]|nr:hypothetical protein CDD83_4679 [Cordyceps sp. RAO-2017]
MPRSSSSRATRPTCSGRAASAISAAVRCGTAGGAAVAKPRTPELHDNGCRGTTGRPTDLEAATYRQARGPGLGAREVKQQTARARPEKADRACVHARSRGQAAQSDTKAVPMFRLSSLALGLSPGDGRPALETRRRDLMEKEMCSTHSPRLARDVDDYPSSPPRASRLPRDQGAEPSLKKRTLKGRYRKGSPGLVRSALARGRARSERLDKPAQDSFAARGGSASLWRRGAADAAGSAAFGPCSIRWIHAPESLDASTDTVAPGLG